MNGTSADADRQQLEYRRAVGDPAMARDVAPDGGDRKPVGGGDTKAYLFCYFTGEDEGAEAIRYALSMGNDALTWRTVNDDLPVVESVHGERGLRDPFVLRSADGETFWLLATDLNTYVNGWTATQQTGSRHIEVWESTDLIHWGEQRHIEVSPPSAGNTWAPEAVYDPAAGQYVVYWASNLYDDAEPRNADTSYNRMMFATTRDFRTFSPAQVWIDDRQDGPGNGTIDASILEEDGWYYRFTVPEGPNIPRVDRSRDLYATLTPDHNAWIGTGDGSGWEPVQDRVGFGQTYRGAASGGELTFRQGEGTTLFRPNHGDVHGSDGVYAFIDQAAYYDDGEGYVVFRAAGLAAGDWTLVADRDLPLSPRHGTVLPITVAEYEAVLAAFQPDQRVVAETVTVATPVGEAPVLPATVTAVLGPDTPSERALGEVPVVWEDIPPARLATSGTILVVGSVRHGGLVRAWVTVG